MLTRYISCVTLLDRIGLWGNVFPYMGYTKLFEDIVASSVWDEDDKVRLVWITMLALKDRYHFVRGTEKFLGLAARVSAEDCNRAL